MTEGLETDPTDVTTMTDPSSVVKVPAPATDDIGVNFRGRSDCNIYKMVTQDDYVVGNNNIQLDCDTINKSEIIQHNYKTKFLPPLGRDNEIFTLFEKKDVDLPTSYSLLVQNLEWLGSVVLEGDEAQVLKLLILKYICDPGQNSAAPQLQRTDPESETLLQLPEAGTSFPVPELSVNGKHLKIPRIRKSIRDLQYSKNLFELTDHEIIVNYVRDDGLVCISSCLDDTHNDSLADLIAEHVKTAPSLVTLPEVDEIVIAPHHGSYYRAKVISVSGVTVWFTFIDYGDDGQANFTELKGLSADIVKHPIYSVTCKVTRTRLEDQDNGSEEINIDIADVDAVLESSENTFEFVEKCETGLQNLGNSCYMNSILQCMNHTVALVDYFQNSHAQLKGIVSAEVGKCFAKLNKGRSHVRISNLQSALRKLNTIYGSNEQHDSHEFLTYLLNRMHDELNQSGVTNPLDGSADERDGLWMCDEETIADLEWCSYLSLNDTIITQLFCGQQKSSVQCLKCHKSSTTFETFLVLSVPIPEKGDKCTIEDCLKLYTANEEISDYSCTTCKTKVRANKKIDIWRLPRILIIQFKRFYMDNWGNLEKRRTKIQFDEEYLIPTCHMTNAQNDQGTYMYQLYAVSNHFGSIECGHYTSFCIRNKIWTAFDDTIVWEILAQNVCTPEAYILFYCIAG